MTLVSITQAAKLAGVSRSTLYSKHINSGAISVSKDKKGKKSIDTSELIRVFGVMIGPDVLDSLDSAKDVQKRQPRTVPDSELDSTLDSVKLELKHSNEKLAVAEKQLQAFEDRERWYQAQMNTLTDTVKLLEDKRTDSVSVRPRLWWQWWK